MSGWLALGAAGACVVGLVIYSAQIRPDRQRGGSDTGGDGGTFYDADGDSCGSDGGGGDGGGGGD